MRTFLMVLAVVALIGGAAALGVTAYNAGLAAGLASGAEGATVVYPYAGWGWHGGGSGFFGFLGFLFVLFLLFGLFRAAAWGGRGWGGPGHWGGPGRSAAGGPGRHGVEGWHEHEGLRELHRRLHEQDSDDKPNTGHTPTA